ncbi:beta-glucuronosyltransferase GlcAT14A-like [Phalaenopsis equestris]|uniref:beta-glucuronosyltransferase GlcAT14A-like n=1 Tax=Phalaenopsis equestris TaxID=78828 RepID=UPI0009E22CBF|nr:beta-glucuronosyltransferase GlcAT14A-like [Phalaenopsis equestris]
MDYLKGRISLPPLPAEKKWALPIFVSSLIFAFLLLTTLNMGLLASLSTLNAALFSPAIETSAPSPEPPPPIPPLSPPPPPPPPAAIIPRFAYLISGSKGDLDSIWRTLYAIYHPRNLYVLHLDLESPAEERKSLAARVANQSVFSIVGNVHVITKANMVTYRGPTMVANTLHACAILLKKSNDWDWFINLSASDYPLVTQDDLLLTFSKLPKNLNFVEHSSVLGWKEEQRAKPLIIDPGLYKTTKSDVFWVAPRRELPTAFTLFTGSAWMVLTREFIEFCIWGWDNLPRTLLMYYTNFLSSPEGYFQTVLCNSPEFNSTVINHDLHYISWDKPPKQHPHILSLNDTAKMIRSNAPFARKFRKDDPVLDKIDAKLLRRPMNMVTPGGWCEEMTNCSKVDNDGRLKPGPGSRRLAKLMNKLVLFDSFKLDQCN